MSISNYSELQTSVASWLHRTDLTTQIPDFISIAENKLNRRLRLRAMENQATGTVASTVALPTGFVEMIALTVNNGGTVYPLTYTTPASLTGTSGTSYRYSIIGDNIYFMDSGSGETYTLTYYKKFDALSAGVNWLITNAPEIYLYASCLEACEFTRDVARIEEFNALLDTAIKRIMDADKFDRYGSDLVIRAA
jgi:hypothetical protein